MTIGGGGELLAVNCDCVFGGTTVGHFQFAEHQPGHIFGFDSELIIFDSLRLHAGFIPVSGKPVNAHPFHSVMAKRVSGELHFVGVGIAAFAHGFINLPGNFLLGLGFIFMPGLWADDVCELYPFALKGERHQVGGLLLFINFATVGYCSGI